MIFTGSQLISKRNFYTQNSNFGVSMDFTVNDPSKRYEFGLTGNNSISLILESGKISYNDIFLHSYSPNQNYNITLGVTDNNINVSKNDVELILGHPKDTGNYDYFFFKRQDTGVNASFDFSVSGMGLPIYSIDTVGYYLTTGQNQVTGLFKNISGFDIRLFRSEAISPQNLSFSGISGLIQSGNNKVFSYNGGLSEFDYTQPIFTIFNTNLGQLNINFSVVDATNLSRFVLLDDIEDFSFNANNEINRTLSYTNYSGGIGGAEFQTDLFFQLSYVSGSGNFVVSDFAQSASFTGLAYGNFLKSGFLTGTASIITGNANISGVYTINFERFGWATGRATGFFSGMGTGISSGINYTGLAYGGFTGLATGLILNGSGTLDFNQSLLVGQSIGESYSINYTGYVNATGYINLSGLLRNDVIYIGIESTPLIKGVQFNEPTGLSYYLNNNSSHQVSSSVVAEVIYLNSLYSGTNGNNTFVRELDCNLGGLTGFSPLLEGGQDIGTTGNAVYAINSFTGRVDTIITGSGNYSMVVSGNQQGLFSFQRTFTGSWDLLTGVNNSSLVLVQKYGDVISGRGNFDPNSSMVFQVNHYDSNLTQDGVSLLISGSDVLNPLTTIISQ